MRIAISDSNNGYKWEKGGENITYGLSNIVKKVSADGLKVSYYSKLQFDFKFDNPSGQIYFAYCFPYTCSDLYNFLSL